MTFNQLCMEYSNIRLGGKDHPQAITSLRKEIKAVAEATNFEYRVITQKLQLNHWKDHPVFQEEDHKTEFEELCHNAEADGNDLTYMITEVTVRTHKPGFQDINRMRKVRNLLADLSNMISDTDLSQYDDEDYE